MLHSFFNFFRSYLLLLIFPLINIQSAETRPNPNSSQICSELKTKSQEFFQLFNAQNDLIKNNIFSRLQMESPYLKINSNKVFDIGYEGKTFEVADFLNSIDLLAFMQTNNLFLSSTFFQVDEKAIRKFNYNIKLNENDLSIMNNYNLLNQLTNSVKINSSVSNSQKFTAASLQNIYTNKIDLLMKWHLLKNQMGNLNYIITSFYNELAKTQKNQEMLQLKNYVKAFYLSLNDWLQGKDFNRSQAHFKLVKDIILSETKQDNIKIGFSFQKVIDVLQNIELTLLHRNNITSYMAKQTAIELALKTIGLFSSKLSTTMFVYGLLQIPGCNPIDVNCTKFTSYFYNDPIAFIAYNRINFNGFQKEVCDQYFPDNQTQNKKIKCNTYQARGRTFFNFHVNRILYGEYCHWTELGCSGKGKLYSAIENMAL